MLRIPSRRIVIRTSKILTGDVNLLLIQEKLVLGIQKSKTDLHKHRETEDNMTDQTEEKKEEVLQTRDDIAFQKKVFLKGKKLGGIQKISFEYSAEGDPRTMVTLKLTVPKDSVKIEKDEISFDIFWDNEPQPEVKSA
jgi:hypothetical protein